MELYRNAGKKAVALLDPFGVPAKAFLIGIQHDSGGKVDADLTPELVDQHLHFYSGVLRFVPSLKSQLDTMSPARLSKIVQMITKGMSEGRSTDLGSVKHKGIKYVPLTMNSKSDALDPSIPEVEDKSMRGIFHPQLAHFMCPAKKLAQYDEDPTAGMAALQAGEISMKASKWPAGFYEEGTMYDPEDKTKGLFRNHIVTRFYLHLFVGPSAVMNESHTRKASKPSKNRAWDLRSVDRYIIAYVHIIAYSTLSQAQQWTQVIGNMDLRDLYWRIVEMLEDKADPWVEDTLAWWNRLSKSNRSADVKKYDKSDSSDDDMAQVHAQRASHQSEPQ
ncbi:hypothetical protein PAXRUDRAFT_16093 [Paxillus rubicundulus Ve08.2h10]|uniref:Uncharacterized protein n=1 Tax=Paxillus rubicundulus Ve08.2h10 TaxID=930991 RepID=A0A0D0DFJ9_9AGAM|nr:hypothetical protein PAXRUDRAFT_16093 [Paxillus rubicundulus Ve08.2h10]